LQGLKPNIDLIGFIGPTEVVPLLQSLCSGHAREFFRKLFEQQGQWHKGSDVFVPEPRKEDVL